MFKNYFKVAFRNLLKNLSYTLINVAGLAVGMGCCFIITIYVRFELSYESFHEKKENIYRYIPKSSNEGELAMQTYTPAGLAPRFANDFREISAYTRVGDVSEKPMFKVGGKMLGSGPFYIADSAFFNIFSFKLVRGSASKALSRPLTIVISESIAEQFFGDEDPIGKSIEYENKLSFEVTGVFQDVPQNSHLQFSYLGSFASLPHIYESVYGYKNDRILEDMGAWNYSSYFLIPAANANELAERMSRKLYEYQTNDAKVPENYVFDWLQPLNEIHFTRGIKGDSGGTGSISYLYIFSAVAAFVLVIACFNFMNLSTALALKRAKEVGLRKSVGATRLQLMFQFIGESAILITLAFLIGLQLVELTLPLFNSLMGMSLHFALWKDNVNLLIVLATGALTALLAGAYPAFYLSSFQASKVLKGESLKGGKSGLRRTLTVAQFGIATFMIIGTMVVFQQMEYMKSASLGFDREHVISFPATVELDKNFVAFKERILKNPGVKAVTYSNGIPGGSVGHWRYKFLFGDQQETSINTVATDYEYLDVIGLQVVDGRPLSPDFVSDDSLAYLINETAVKEYMLDKPVGTPFQVLDGQHPPGKIVGVVKDFHFRSLQHRVEPLVIRIDPHNRWLLAIKLNSGDYKAAIAAIQKEWNLLAGERPFEYTFLDDDFERQYQSEQKIGVLMTIFSGLAIFVACLGLMGLTSFLTQQRRKEISIRKVHGATVRDVVALLSWDFIKLVLMGFLIMAPVAWYGAREWLQNFAYKVSIGPLVFLLAGFAIATLALITVSYQSYKASLTNPADVLKEP
jgi:putative ABC transport system permease protein